MDQAEQLRIIKANQQQSRPLARVITVTSGKGGVGKSNTSINLAIQFRKLGKRVIILDADFGLANIEIMFGAVPKHNLCDLIYQGKSITEIITWGPMEVGFISGGSGIAGMSNLSRDYLSYIIQNLSQLDAIADVIIVDTGAGISDTVMEFVVASSEVIVVATPEPTSITDAYSLLKTLKRKVNFDEQNTAIRVVGNRVRKNEDGEELFQKLGVVVRKFLDIDIELIGLIPYDDKCQLSIMKQSPVSLEYPEAPSSRAFRTLAGKLTSQDTETDAVKQGGIRALFSNVIRLKLKK